MRYRESKETSAEILRLVLPHIARHGSGFEPPSYTIWYEYVAGTNEPLKSALEERIKAHLACLTGEETQALHSQFIAQCDAAAPEQLQVQLRAMLEQMARAATVADTDANHFGKSLQSYAVRLTRPVDVEALREIVGALVVETQRMERSNMALRERLEADGRTLATMKAEFAALQNEALLDPLTNLMNRRGFRHALDQLASRSPNGLTGALLMADIDHFKRINDEHGHLLGDKVLQTVAQVLRSCIKGRDVASRFGGEEFAVLLPDTSEQGALAVAEQIRRTVEQGRMRRSDRGKPIGGVTISIGIAIYRPSDDLEVWIGRADEALYRSKRQGRNRVSVANPSGPQSGLDGRGGEGGGANLSDESSHD